MSHTPSIVRSRSRTLPRALVLAASFALLPALAPSIDASPSTPPAGRPGQGGQGGPGGPGGQGGQGGAGGRAPAGARGADRGASVEGSMKAMNGSLRRLKASIGDATQKDANLRLIDQMQISAATAKSLPLPPELLQKAGDDAAKAKLQSEFRESLIKLLRETLEMEQAVISGRVEVAKSRLAEVEKLRDEAHKALGVDEH